MKKLLNKLNDANRIMNSVNRTTSNVNATRRNVNSISSGTNRLGSRFGRTKNQAVATPQEESWKCACGKKVSTKFCEHCGLAKPACPNCGASANGAKFCAECGTPMDASISAPEVQPATATCDGCGADTTGAKFCPSCGMPVGA